MQAPNQADYVKTYFTLFEKFEQAQEARLKGRPYKYEQKQMIVFYTIMMFRRIHTFKAQRRWLETHSKERASLAFSQIPQAATASIMVKSPHDCY